MGTTCASRLLSVSYVGASMDNLFYTYNRLHSIVDTGS